MMSISGRMVQTLGSKFSSLTLKNSATPLVAAKANFFTDRALETKLPERPPSAFSSFVKAEFPALKSQNPNASAPEVMKKVAERFKALPVSKKEALLADSKKRSDAYKQELLKLKKSPDGMKLLEERRKATHSKSIKSLQAKIRKIKREAKRPAKAGNAYSTYVQANIAKFQGAKASDRMKQAAQSWKNLSESEKQAFRDQALKAKAESAKTMKDWETKNKTSVEQIETLQKKIVDLRKMIRTDPNAPKPKKIRKKAKKVKKVVKKKVKKAKKKVVAKKKKVVAKKKAVKKTAKKTTKKPAKKAVKARA